LIAFQTHKTIKNGSDRKLDPENVVNPVDYLFCTQPTMLMRNIIYV